MDRSKTQIGKLSHRDVSRKSHSLLGLRIDKHRVIESLPSLAEFVDTNGPKKHHDIECDDYEGDTKYVHGQLSKLLSLKEEQVLQDSPTYDALVVEYVIDRIGKLYKEQPEWPEIIADIFRSRFKLGKDYDANAARSEAQARIDATLLAEARPSGESAGTTALDQLIVEAGIDSPATSTAFQTHGEVAAAETERVRMTSPRTEPLLDCASNNSQDILKDTNFAHVASPVPAPSRSIARVRRLLSHELYRKKGRWFVLSAGALSLCVAVTLIASGNPVQVSSKPVRPVFVASLLPDTPFNRPINDAVIRDLEEATNAADLPTLMVVLGKPDAPRIDDMSGAERMLTKDAHVGVLWLTKDLVGANLRLRMNLVSTPAEQVESSQATSLDTTEKGANTLAFADRIADLIRKSYCYTSIEYLEAKGDLRGALDLLDKVASLYPFLKRELTFLQIEARLYRKSKRLDSYDLSMSQIGDSPFLQDNPSGGYRSPYPMSAYSLSLEYSRYRLFLGDTAGAYRACSNATLSNESAKIEGFSKSGAVVSLDDPSGKNQQIIMAGHDDCCVWAKYPRRVWSGDTLASLKDVDLSNLELYVGIEGLCAQGTGPYFLQPNRLSEKGYDLIRQKPFKL